LRRFPVVVLSGLRQSGKSTLLKNEVDLVRGHAYRTMDDFATLKAAKSDPESLLRDDVVLDEVQRCPEIFLAIKKTIDEDRRPGRFILSGSANLTLLHHVSESLAGRAAYFALQPLTRREIRRETTGEPFLKDFLASYVLREGESRPITESEILAGGLPPACLGSQEDLREWFRAYVQTYVERDVRQIARISDLLPFRTLAQLAALRTGQVLSVSHLARDAGLKAARAARYIDLLETSFLIRRLPPFLKNRSSRLIKMPKLHFTDSGLAAHLAGIDCLEPDRDDLIKGALFETYVVQNVAALLEAHCPEARLGFWHEQGRHEVDLVVEVGEDVLAIEVKTGSRWQKSDLSGLNAFLERTPQCRAAILAYNGTRAVQLGDRLYAIPMAQLIS